MGDTEGEGKGEGETEGEAPLERVAVGVGVCVLVGVSVGEGVGDGVGVGAALGEAVPLLDRDRLPVLLGDAPLLSVPVALRVREGVAERVLLIDGGGVPVALGVSVAV